MPVSPRSRSPQSKLQGAVGRARSRQGSERRKSSVFTLARVLDRLRMVAVHNAAHSAALQGVNLIDRLTHQEAENCLDFLDGFQEWRERAEEVRRRRQLRREQNDPLRLGNSRLRSPESPTSDPEGREVSSIALGGRRREQQQQQQQQGRKNELQPREQVQRPRRMSPFSEQARRESAVSTAASEDLDLDRLNSDRLAGGSRPPSAMRRGQRSRSRTPVRFQIGQERRPSTASFDFPRPSRRSYCPVPLTSANTAVSRFRQTPEVLPPPVWHSAIIPRPGDPQQARRAKEDWEDFLAAELVVPHEDVLARQKLRGFADNNFGDEDSIPPPPPAPAPPRSRRPTSAAPARSPSTAPLCLSRELFGRVAWRPASSRCSRADVAACGSACPAEGRRCTRFIPTPPPRPASAER
eukprot:TRINITY_DN13373_c2_g1_i1.p1 TRINITY_DN13373_c2_g1~~TRINITY_DN13373_c2_g1_i1.p1  ORF type:complete len:410 (+),score=108.28 TRINITY_DN13373_c2_g1_i1:78-1307(+)